MGADTKANTRGLVRAWAAYSSDCSVELPLRPSARAAAPFGTEAVDSQTASRGVWLVVRSVNGR